MNIIFLCFSNYYWPIKQFFCVYFFYLSRCFQKHFGNSINDTNNRLKLELTNNPTGVPMTLVNEKRETPQPTRGKTSKRFLAKSNNVIYLLLLTFFFVHLFYAINFCNGKNFYVFHFSESEIQSTIWLKINLVDVIQMWFIHAYIEFQKIIQNYFFTPFKIGGKNRFIKSVRLLPLNMKSINLVQKYWVIDLHFLYWLWYFHCQ